MRPAVAAVDVRSGAVPVRLRHLVRKRIAHLFHRNRGGPFQVDPGHVLVGRAGAEDPEGLGLVMADLPVLADAADGVVGHPKLRGLIAELVAMERIAAGVPIAQAAHLDHVSAHHRDRPAGRMSRIVHRAGDQAAAVVLRLQPLPLRARLAGQPAPLDLPQIAARVLHVVEVLALRIDEPAERARRAPAPAIHRFRSIERGLTEHVVEPGPLHRPHQTIAPLQDLVAVRHHDDRHGAVDVLAGFQRGDRLRGMQPRLRDDRHRVEVGRAQIVQGAVRVGRRELVPERRVAGEAVDALRLAVAQGDAIDLRVELEQTGEGGAERTEPDDSQGNTHYPQNLLCQSAAGGPLPACPLA